MSWHDMICDIQLLAKRLNIHQIKMGISINFSLFMTNICLSHKFFALAIALDPIFSQRYIIKTSKVEKWAKESKLKKTSVLSLWEWQKEEQQFQRL